jgi:hypothetical protein
MKTMLQECGSQQPSVVQQASNLLIPNQNGRSRYVACEHLAQIIPSKWHGREEKGKKLKILP